MDDTEYAKVKVDAMFAKLGVINVAQRSAVEAVLRNRLARIAYGYAGQAGPDCGPYSFVGGDVYNLDAERQRDLNSIREIALYADSDTELLILLRDAHWLGFPEHPTQRDARQRRFG